MRIKVTDTTFSERCLISILSLIIVIVDTAIAFLAAQESPETDFRMAGNVL